MLGYRNSKGKGFFMSVQYVSILAGTIFMVGIAQAGFAHQCQLQGNDASSSADIINARQI